MASPVVKDRRRKSMKASPWKAVEAFRAALRTKYGDGLHGLILYGSLARGEWISDSDKDVAVLLDDRLDIKTERDAIWKVAWSLFDECGELIEPMVWSEQAFQRGGWPIHFNLRREGWFIMPEEQPFEVHGLLTKARRHLRTARTLLESDDADSAASRAYHAMFNSAQAALLSRGFSRSRHEGVHAAFGYYFVRNGQFPSELHALLESSYKKRIIADYSPESLTEIEATEVVDGAERFIDKVEKLLAGDEA